MKTLVLTALGLLFAVLNSLPKQQAAYLVGTPTSERTQKFTVDDFEYLENATKEKVVPHELAHWLEKDRVKTDRESGCNEGESSEEVEIFVIGKYRESRMYIINKPHSCICGAHGNCPLELLLADKSGIHLIGSLAGWGAAVRERAGEHWPYVFFIQHVSTDEASISGFHLGNDSLVRHYCGGSNLDKSNVVNVHPCK